MVDLPTINRGVSTLKAPESEVSPQQVAAPYVQLANTLTKAGEGLETLAETQAREAGANAVRTDDQGKLVIDHAPIIGPASQEYARAARMTYLARIQPEIENKMTELRLANPNDPRGFKRAAEAYTAQLATDVGDPMLRNPVMRIAADTAGSNFRTAMVQADHQNTQNAFTAYQSRLTIINNQTADLARQGALQDPNSEAYKKYVQLASDRVQILTKELPGDARFGYPKERAQEELQNAHDADVVQSGIGEVVRAYKTKQNAVEARQMLQDIFLGPGSEKLNLSIAKREHAVVEGVKALQGMDLQDRAEVAENKAAARTYIAGVIKDPGSFDTFKHNNTKADTLALGDRRTVMELDALERMVPWLQTAKNADPAQLVPALQQMRKGYFPDPVEVSARIKTAMDFFQARGWTKEQASGIVGNLVQESSALNPAEAHDPSVPGGGIGIAGWNRERRVLLQQFAKQQGTSETDFNTQLQFIDQELRTSESGAGDLLKAATTPEAAAAAMVHFERPAGYTPQTPHLSSGFANRLNNAKAVAAGLPVGGQSVAALDPATRRLFEATTISVRESVSKGMDKLADNIISTLTDKRQAVTPDEMHTFIDGVVASGRQDLVPKVSQALDAYEKLQGVRQAGGLSQALHDQVAALAASGVDPVKREILNKTLDMAQKDQAALQKDPLSQGAVTGIVKPINPINMGDPNAAAVELHDRDGKLQAIQQRYPDLQPSSVIGASDGRAVANALTAGPVDKAQGFLENAARVLSPETYKATMATDEMKQALITMSRSSDPARMAVGMSTLDHLWRIGTADFEKTYGETTLNRMLAWNGLKGALPPDQIAERLNRADDPQLAAARKTVDEQVKTELANQKPKDVINMLGTFAERNIPFVNADVARNVSVPTAEVVQAEYQQLYKALRTYGVDADTAGNLAVEQLKKTWRESEITGTIMKNRPDDHYPEIDGSRTWMAKQLYDTVAQRYGPRTPTGAFGGPNWRIVGVLGDAQTEAEIAAGKPPSYKVTVQDQNGMLQFWSDPYNPNNTRFAWDPKPFQIMYDYSFGMKRSMMLDVKDIMGGAGSDMPVPQFMRSKSTNGSGEGSPELKGGSGADVLDDRQQREQYNEDERAFRLGEDADKEAFVKKYGLQEGIDRLDDEIDTLKGRRLSPSERAYRKELEQWRGRFEERLRSGEETPQS